MLCLRCSIWLHSAFNLSCNTVISYLYNHPRELDGAFMSNAWVILLIYRFLWRKGVTVLPNGLSLTISLVYMQPKSSAVCCWCDYMNNCGECRDLDIMIMIFWCFCSVSEFLIKSDLLNIQHSLSDLAAIGYSQKASLWIAYGFRWLPFVVYKATVSSLPQPLNSDWFENNGIYTVFSDFFIVFSSFIYVFNSAAF